MHAVREVVDLLETLGRSPAHDVPSLLGAGEPRLDPAVLAALQCNDVATLSRMLGGRQRMMCNIFLPDGDEPRRDEEQPDQEGEVPDEAEIRQVG